MREQITAFLVAVQFETTCPPIIRRLFTPQELGRAVGYFPLTGMAMGLLLALLSTILDAILPRGVAGALLLVAWVLMSGALHLDGFLDACDGLFGGFTPEDRLRIMRDERIGGYAMIGGALLLIVQFAALASLVGHQRVFILTPILGRWAMSLLIVSYPYARAQGLGRDMKDNAGQAQLALATVTALIASLLIGASGMIAFLVTLGVTLAGARWILRRIPGMTGDVYGAMCILIETITLVVFVAGLQR